MQIYLSVWLRGELQARHLVDAANVADAVAKLLRVCPQYAAMHIVAEGAWK